MHINKQKAKKQMTSKPPTDLSQFIFKSQKKTNWILILTVAALLIGGGVLIYFAHTRPNAFLPTTLKTNPSNQEPPVAYVDANFDDAVQKGNSVVMFTRPGCPHCVNLMPNFTKASIQSPHKFITVNVEESPELAKRYKIPHLPLIMRFKNGTPVDMYAGDRSTPSLVRFATL